MWLDRCSSHGWCIPKCGIVLDSSTTFSTDLSFTWYLQGKHWGGHVKDIKIELFDIALANPASINRLSSSKAHLEKEPGATLSWGLRSREPRFLVNSSLPSVSKTKNASKSGVWTVSVMRSFHDITVSCYGEGSNYLQQRHVVHNLSPLFPSIIKAE